MQLFTLGLNQLNEDGSLQLDGSGNPIPTYSQNDVQSFARVFTGWTYPTMPNATLAKHNPAYWLGAMQPFESNHDTGSEDAAAGKRNGDRSAGRAIVHSGVECGAGQYFCSAQPSALCVQTIDSATSDQQPQFRVHQTCGHGFR